MTDQRIRIVWKDIAEIIGECPEFMCAWHNEAFRQALAETGYYRDELQVYEVEGDKYPSPLKVKMIEAIKSVADKKKRELKND